MCWINSRNAKSRGRKPGVFVFITVALMFGLGILFDGIVLFMRLPDILADTSVETSDMTALIELITDVLSKPLLIGTYSALAIGGIISFLIARNCKKGDYFPGQQSGQFGMNGQYGPFNGPSGQYGGFGQPYGQQMPYGQPAYYAYGDNAAGESVEGQLQSPCTLRIIREAAQNGANEVYTFSLNGHPVCTLANGMMTSIPVMMADNTITARDGTGMSLKNPLRFTAAAGGYVEIHVKAGQFLPGKTIGKKPIEQPVGQETAH